MKMGICKATTLTVLLICAFMAMMPGCRSDSKTDRSDGSSGVVVVVPHGYMARLEQVHDGRMIGFGPFVGYYFRPEDPGDLSRLQFVCFNENRFYSSDMPNGTKLYEGMAVRTTLPLTDAVIPAQDRINPVFFGEAPEAWRDTRPEPQDEFVHFHSCYDAAGPAHTGYHIHATDGEIGHVEDFMVDDENWAIRFLVAATRNWLPGKKVILSHRWIKHVQWADSLVYFDLTRESVENSLEFNPSKPISRDYEAFLLDHFGQSMQKKNDHEGKKNTSKGEEKWQKKWKFISAKFAEISLKYCMAVTVNWSAAASR